MEYSEDPQKIAEWVPLVMQGRDRSEKVAATRIATGTDVDYGALTRNLMGYLKKLDGVSCFYDHAVVNVAREKNGPWRLGIKDRKRGEDKEAFAKFVFLGAGGGTLPLLQKSGIEEIRGYAGFPVSGLWLRCDDPVVSQKHQAKVYGKASVGSPPMSVPHLDTRVVEGKKSILFGPYAGFSPKFLKHGSYLDLFHSIKGNNIHSLWTVAKDNLPLTKYLIKQVLQTAKHRFSTLQEFYPEAKEEDWRLEVAGQRVQVIRPDPKRGAILAFGTELVASTDRSLVGLLGASPGASTAVFIVIDLLEKCFKTQMIETEYLPRLREIIPSYGHCLIEDAALCKKIRIQTADILKIGEA
jgi:malate dehydrogenase (quinone)